MLGENCVRSYFKIGMELEVVVLDSSFNELNEADLLINECKKQGLDVKGEGTKNMIEINSIPGDSKKVHEDVVYKFKKLNKIANSLNLIVLPIDSSIDQNFKPVVRKDGIYKIKNEILGNSFYQCGNSIALHYHLDLAPKTLRGQQVNMLKLLDPLLASIGSTTTGFKDDTEIQNLRLYIYRNIVYEQFPNNGGFLGLTKNFGGFLQQVQKISKNFMNSYKGEADVYSLFDPYKGVWGPVRYSPETKTLEVRTPGSCPDFKANYELTKFMELYNYIISSQKYNLSDFLLNQFGTTDYFKVSYKLKKISNESIISGLNSKRVMDYCNNLLDFLNIGELTNKFLLLQKYKLERHYILNEKNTTVAQKYKKLYLLCLDSINYEIGKNYFLKPLEVEEYAG